MVRVRPRTLTPEQVKATTNLLRYTNPDYIKIAVYGSKFCREKPPQFVPLTKTDPSNGDLMLPRAWAVESMVRGELQAVPIKTAEVKVEWPELKISPLPHQFDAVVSAMNLINERDEAGFPTDTYIKMPPSEGKTIAGMILARQIGLRTLVVVPTQEIEEAWLSDAERVLGIKPDDIGRIRGKSLRIGDVLTVGSVQTLMDLDPSLWSGKFGVTLYDEVHRISARRFIEVVQNDSAHIRVGLTATDYRKDGTFIAVNRHLGDKAVFSTDQRTNSVPLVYCPVMTNFGVTSKKGRGGDEHTFSDVVTNLLENQARNEAIFNTLKMLVGMDGDILVVCPRTEWLEWAAGYAQQTLGVTVALITGSTKNRKALYLDIKAGKYRATFATTSIVCEGASNPRWFHLLNTAPFTDRKTCIQLSGRVIRKVAGKTAGYMWDFVDSNAMTYRMGLKRYGFLKPVIQSASRYCLDHRNTPVHSPKSAH